jgi:hypothetical protein
MSDLRGGVNGRDAPKAEVEAAGAAEDERPAFCRTRSTTLKVDEALVPMGAELPHISFLKRIPLHMGTEFKTAK